MRLLLLCFVFSLLLSLSSVLGYGDGHRWHPEREGAWNRLSITPPSPADLHSFTVALRHHKPGVATLKDIVSEVSNPLSTHYGNYLSVSEIRSLLMGPDGESSTATIKDYFLDHGAESVDEVSTGDALVVTMRIDRLESLFHIKMHSFSHRFSGRRIRRSLSAPHLPSHIAQKIELISGLYDFFDHSIERKMGKTMLLSSKQMEGNCSATNAPEVLKVKGGADDFSATVAVYCLDYSISSNTTDPCSDHPPVAQSLTVIYQSHGYAPESLVLNFSSLECSIAAGGKLLCQIPHTKIIPYQRLSVSAFVTYANGKESSVGEYMTQHTPSPFVTPDKIRDYYGVPHGLKGTNPNNYQSVNAFELQYVDVQGDIQPFFESVGIEWTEPSIIGQNDPKTPGGESTLDLTYIMAIGQGVKTSFISVTGSGPAIPPGNGAYILEWAVQVNNMTNPPLVTSISYGDTEDGYYNKFNGSYIYIERTDAELLKMAARGLTVIAGSGDAGASNVGEAGNDISPTDPDCSVARPFYPSNSHYVTSLSSTFLTTNYLPICSMKISNTEPIVCDRVGEASVSVSEGIYWTTGGAFGWRNGANPRASWQQESVDHYLKTQADKLPPSDFFHSEGRGYPDISTIGHNLLMRLGNQLTTVDGTSASGPVFAGLVSLWNDARLNANLPSMGLLNPFLYQTAKSDSNAVFDIVKGSNNDGDLQQRCSNYPTYCPYGFIAAPGWDAVSGLGTPNWPVLRDAALKYATNAVNARKQGGNHHSMTNATEIAIDKVDHIMSLKKKKH